MFNNLIESSSHKSELKRRGSFFLFTVASYALLFVIAGVASIYAYDARLEDQSLELVTMMPITDFPVAERITPERTQPGARNTNTNPALDVRRNPTAPIDLIPSIPDKISSQPNPDLPVRGVYTVGPNDSNAAAPGGLIKSGGDTAGGGSGPVRLVEVTTPPPPITEQKPKPATISKGVINGEAKSLPPPAYPLMAKQIHLQGKVTVQVLIDETGKVISARAIDGHPLFRKVSENAAYQALFSPTKLSNEPVKVSGMITYNFVLQ